jgi:CBS domain-containing protein
MTESEVSLAHSSLRTYRLSPGTCIVQAQPPMGVPVTPASPGRAVMTDLTHVRAATVGPEVGLAQARDIMIHQGVRLLFVVSQVPGIDGLLTSVDLEGERPMQVMATRGLRHDDLVVADVMSPLSTLDAIDLEDLAHANVAQVIDTLKQVGRRHLIVIQKPGHGIGPRVRGVISLAQIERQLGQTIGVVETASGFAELRAMLTA